MQPRVYSLKRFLNAWAAGEFNVKWKATSGWCRHAISSLNAKSFSTNNIKQWPQLWLQQPH